LGSSSSDSDEGLLEEWKEARSVLARFDNDQHDLRKYGFSFLTALLTADSMLGQVAGASGVVIPDYVKLFVLVTTLGLVFTLRFLDMHYTLFNAAASVRARIIERNLNLDITNEISFYHGTGAWWKQIRNIYCLFAILTCLLGSAILYPSISEISVLTVSTIIIVCAIFLISQTKLAEAEDWSVDRKVGPQGLPIRITWTNISNQSLTLPRNHPAWKITELSDKKFDEEPVRDWDIILGRMESYDWLWNTERITPGLYNLVGISVRDPSYEFVQTLQIVKSTRLGP
jgi:hypothetical protein